MNLQHSIVCTSCQQPFSTSNLPRVAPCSHTYCQQCLGTLDHCTIDQQPYDLLIKVEDLPINTAIMKLIKPARVNQSIEKCLLHDKEIDLVCVDHRVGICTNCALFGEHKNHNIKTVKSVMEECAVIAEQTIAIVTEIEDLQNTGSIKALQNKVQVAFKDKKELITKQIKAKFYKIIESIRNIEKNCLSDLDKVIEEQKNILKGGFQKSTEDQKKRGWIKEAQRLIQIVDSQRIDEASKYLNSGCAESGLIKKGEYLIMQLHSRQNLLDDRLKQSIAQINFEMNNSTFESQLMNSYRLKKVVKQNEYILKTQRILDDEFLLEEQVEQLQQQTFPVTPSTIEKQHIIDSASSSMYIDIPELIIQKTGINIQSFVEKSQRKAVDRSMIKQPLGVSNLDNKKRKRIKIPQKYESVFDDLKNDRLQCVDFTNAELGDAILIQLTDYFKNSSKLRTIKLIRNKLSDECLMPLLDACRESRIISLNLGQNSFTDKAFDLIEKMELKDLKNLTLSQNKINQRNSKVKVAEFKKRGLTISI